MSSYWKGMDTVGSWEQDNLFYIKRD